MTYRNSTLLRLAEKAPHCMLCGARNDRQVVSAHSNRAIDGKAMGLKASDAAIAFVCALPCHVRIDQGRESREIRTDLWERAHRATMRWLIESGHLVASIEPQDPPTPKPKRKAKISSGRKIQSRGFEKSATPQKIPSRPFPKRSDR